MTRAASLALALLLLPLQYCGAQSPLSAYAKLQRAVLPWLTPLANLSDGCGGPSGPPCNLTHLALACSNSSAIAAAAAAAAASAASPLVPCTWSALLKNAYIPHCMGQAGNASSALAAANCQPNFPTVAAAQAACAADARCGGITSQPAQAAPWELRASTFTTHDPTGEASYQITNPAACHGAPPPPPPPPPPQPCNAFDTNGLLFHCPNGACGCESGSAACLRGRDVFSEDQSKGLGAAYTDLYVRAGAPPPAEWVAPIAAATLLYASPEPTECYLPEVGNGYLATVPGWGSLHVAGLFNGRCGTTHKARFPSPAAISLQLRGAPPAAPPASVTAAALDMAHGAYLRRWALGASTVQQRTWAHRARKHLLVTDFTLLEGPPVAFNLSTLWDPLVQWPHGPGAGCAGGFSVDFAFEGPAPVAGGPPGAQAWRGATLAPSDAGLLFNVSVALDAVPQHASLASPGDALQFLAAIATSLDFPGDAGSASDVAALAAAQYSAAAALAPAALWEEHASAWAALAAPGIAVQPATNDPADVARALDIAAHAASSQYFLLSSLRADAVAGISPGGLASESYQGAVFMDAELWMEPPLYFLAPELAASVLQYRYLSLPVMAQLAVQFGFGAFNGTMAAWTAAYRGHPFGCCSASGGYEDCLEQHVTGDIAVSAWQYWAATGDEAWLAGVGWPLLAGTADFHLARVSPALPAGAAAPLPPGTALHITGVLPIDEWAVGAGCGAEDPGVADDAQMNGVAKGSLLLAAAAARLLGKDQARAALWEAVGQAIVLPLNASGHHTQFTSPTCPGGWGGSHYATAHTVCPEDVLLLTYPLGAILNTSAAASRADAELFIPLTCLENAGMTTPVHAIVWLQLGEAALAEAEFNRSMHAACYGPFNVRNEVDKHLDMPGAHYDNSHFLTGDGGYLQALLNGFGGLRVEGAGLRLLAPALPGSVGELTLRAIRWRGCSLTVSVSASQQTVQLLAGAGGQAALCLTDARGARQALAAGGPPLALSRAEFAYPGLLTTGSCA